MGIVTPAWRLTHSRRLIDADPLVTRICLLLRIGAFFTVGSYSEMDSAIRKAETLIEALSYIRQFRNRYIVIKLGGSAMEEPDALKATLEDVIFMATVGLRPIIVHGGGKPIDRAMADSGLQPRKVLGR